MSTVPGRFRLLAVAVVVILVAGVSITRWIVRAPDERPPDSPRTADSQPAAAGQAAGRGARLAAPENAPVPPPTAAWLTAAASPIVIEAPVLGARIADSEVSAGGGIVVLTAERRRFTLFVPEGALTLNATVELVPVPAMSGLPFASGRVTAVHVRNLPADMRKPAILTIDPVAADAADVAATTATAAVFAIAPASRELHLQPFLHAEAPLGRLVQHRYKLLISGDGTYGVTEATAQELDAIDARVPTDYGARVEMAIARALRTAATRPVAARSRGWSFLPVIFAQTDPGRSHLPDFVAQILPKLREYYDQVLMPTIKAFRDGCTEEKRAEMASLNVLILNWIKWSEILGLASGESEKISPEVVAQKDMYPYTYQLEVERSEFFTKLRLEFEQRQEALKREVQKLLQGALETLNRCCASEPKRWMPAAIQGLHRELAIGGGKEEITDKAMSDVAACVCLLDAVEKGAGWTGSISFRSSHQGEANSATSRSRTKTISSGQYAVTVTLMGGSENGDAIGLAMSSGQSSRVTERVDTDWACAEDRAGHSVEVSGGRGAEMGSVGISIRGDGSYSISYPQPLAIGLERTHSYSKRAGCHNRFNDRESDDRSMRAGAVTGEINGTIQGKATNLRELAGSQPFTLPEQHLKRNREASVTWRLSACAAR